MKIINLTPHAVTIFGHGYSPEGEAIPMDQVIPPSGEVARLAATQVSLDPVFSDEGVVLQVSRRAFGAVTGLPAPIDGTLYLVSALVAEQARRADLVCPGELYRDAGGNVIGARGLCKVL